MEQLHGNDPESTAAFPFLRLPAELRDRTYEILLGGLTIHVGEPGGNGPNSSDREGIFICQATITNGESFAESSVASAHSEEADTLEERHENCLHSLGRVVALDVLRVCKQIHREATQVIYHANTFTFSQPRSLQLFLSSLTPVHQRAISSILLYSYHKQRYWAQPLSRSLTIPLIGLRRLQVFVELAPGDLVPNYYHEVVTVENQDVALSGLAVFRSCPLEHVKVMILDTPLPTQGAYSQLAKPTRAQIASWATRVEHMILPPPPESSEEVDSGEEGDDDDDGTSEDEDKEESSS